MEIRSVTLFADPTQSLNGLPAAVAQARETLFDAGYRLQTVRLATTPFPEWLHELGQVASLVEWARETGIDYVALGPVRLDDDCGRLDQIAEVIERHEMVFASAEIADIQGRIDLGRVREVAELIRRLATVQADGFANLFFTANANCPAGSPFFPVAFKGSERGNTVDVALAIEAADLAVTAFKGASSLAEARERLVRAIEAHAAALVETVTPLTVEHGLCFRGIDFSLAPYPEAARSLGTALEALGIPAVGARGSVFGAAFMADCVDRATFPRCGFSGLMFPVLEDAVLAQRAAEEVLTVSELLLYSSVCGAGLDTIPLPGDVSGEAIAAILLDLAALAVRSNKPLTARLMPLPGLATRDPVSFDFPYFADSGVMAPGERGLGGVLGGDERIDLRPRLARG